MNSESLSHLYLHHHHDDDDYDSGHNDDSDDNKDDDFSYGDDKSNTMPLPPYQQPSSQFYIPSTTENSIGDVAVVENDYADTVDDVATPCEWQGSWCKYSAPTSSSSSSSSLKKHYFMFFPTRRRRLICITMICLTLSSILLGLSIGISRKMRNDKHRTTSSSSVAAVSSNSNTVRGGIQLQPTTSSTKSSSDDDVGSLSPSPNPGSSSSSPSSSPSSVSTENDMPAPTTEPDPPSTATPTTTVAPSMAPSTAYPLPTSAPAPPSDTPTPEPTICETIIEADRECYEHGDPVMIAFKNCVAVHTDWVGVYDVSYGGLNHTDLGDEYYGWLWSCNSLSIADCNGVGTFMEELNFGGALPEGTYQAFLIRLPTAADIPYSSYASSPTFVVTESCV